MIEERQKPPRSKRRTLIVVAGWSAVISISAFFGRVARGHRFPADVRFYGTWDVYLLEGGHDQPVDTWVLEPPGFFGPTLAHHRSSRGVYWGVLRDQFLYDTDARRGPRRYDITYQGPDKILLLGPAESGLVLRRAL